MRAIPQKATKIVKVIVDPRGRYLRPEEFKWLMDWFPDRYHPYRLAIAVGYAAGLRPEDYVQLRFSWFSKDFLQLKMHQCKPHVNKKDGVERVTYKPKNHPLPQWLATDLKHYAQYRRAVCHMSQGGDPDRLFPGMKKTNLANYFSKLRTRNAKKQPWLKEVWFYTIHYDAEGKEIRRHTWYRFAPHMVRAAHAVNAYDVVGKDYAKAKLITGHDEMKDIQRYTRFTEVEDLKKELIDRYVEPLLGEQKTPLAKGQSTLKKYF